MGYNNQKKRASKATKSVDKAQNALLKDMKKDLDELKSSVETKYGYQVISSFVTSYDGTDNNTRQANIYGIDIGSGQGLSDFNQRVGDQVTFKHLDLHYRIHLASPRTTEFVDPQQTVRVLVFWDNQPTAITTAGAVAVNPVYWPQLLQQCVTGAVVNDQKQLIMMSEKDWDQRKRFSFVYDKTHTLASGLNSVASAISTGASGPRGTTGCVSFTKNYKGQKIRYIGSGTMAQNRKLYYAFLSDISNDVGTSPNIVTALRPTIHLQTRVLYDDI